SQTFEQALYKLFKSGQITKEEALRNADSSSNLSSLIDFSQTSKVKAYDPNATQPSAPAKQNANFEGIKLNIDVSGSKT
ncbi:MAG: type IV pili twitching motility protein PilT, partial [Pseudomonadota bacterium]